MIEAISAIMNKLPPLTKRVSPGLACVLGFAFGGIGLAIYFLSAVDLFLPLGITIAVTYVFGDAGLLAGAVMAALYGYFRAMDSNARFERSNS